MLAASSGSTFKGYVSTGTGGGRSLYACVGELTYVGSGESRSMLESCGESRSMIGDWVLIGTLCVDRVQGVGRMRCNLVIMVG